MRRLVVVSREDKVMLRYGRLTESEDAVEDGRCRMARLLEESSADSVVATDCKQAAIAHLPWFSLAGEGRHGGVATMAKPRMDLSAFVGKLLEADPVDTVELAA